MSAIYNQIFRNAIRHQLDEIRFYCALARSNKNNPKVRVAQLSRARRAADEIRSTFELMRGT